MATWLRERREADEFARLLDEAEAAPPPSTVRVDGGSERTAHDAEPDDTQRMDPVFEHRPARERRRDALPVGALARTATILRSHAQAHPPHFDEERRAELRAELVAALPEVVAAGVARRERSRAGRHRNAGGDLPVPGRHRLLAAGAGLGAVIVAAGGVAVASTDVMPGSPLYSVKRTVEKVQLDLSNSPTDRGERYLELGVTRINEIDWLLRDRDPATLDPAARNELENELRELNEAVTHGGPLLLDQAEQHHDQRAGHDLAAFLSTYEAPVAQLAQRLPGSLSTAPSATEALMRQLASRLSVVAPVLGGVGTIPTAPPTSAAPGSPAPGTSGRQSSTATPSAPSSTAPGSETSPGGGSSVKVPLPLPVGSTDVTVPPLLPGLPTIGIGIGTTAQPTPSATPTGAPPGDPNPDD